MVYRPPAPLPMPPLYEPPIAYADNTVVARALANLGWLQPASALPVLGIVQPVVQVGAVRVPNLTQVGSTSAVQRGTIFDFTVPSGMIWEVIAVGMFCVVAATASLGSFCPFVQYASVQIPWGALLSTPSGAPAANELLCGFSPPSQLLVAGTRFGFMYVGPNDVTATALPTLLLVQRTTP